MDLRLVFLPRLQADPHRFGALSHRSGAHPHLFGAERHRFGAQMLHARTTTPPPKDPRPALPHVRTRGSRPPPASAQRRAPGEARPRPPAGRATKT